MSSIEFDLRFHELVATLQPAIIEGVAQGVLFANGGTGGVPRLKYPHLYPLLMRIGFREFLDSYALPDGWEVGGNPALMGQTSLISDDYEVRFLKERRRTYPGGVPPAGRNEARRRFYQQAPLVGFEEVAGDLRRAVRERLLLLWDYADPESNDDVIIRLVRPTGAGTYGREVPIDLSLELNSLTPDMKFIGDDEADLDLFKVAILKEENQDDAERSS